MNNELDEIYTTVRGDNYLSSLFGSYKRAIPYIMGRTVCDYGCGYGWGTYFLSHFSKHIVGADIDQERINYAREHLVRSNLVFRTMDKDKIEINFDVVCLLQVIQWVYAPEALLETLKMNLNDNGIFIITTKESCQDAVSFLNSYALNANTRFINAKSVWLGKHDSIIEYIIAP